MTRTVFGQILLTLLLVLGAGCDKATYEVKGSGKATVTYLDGQSQTEKDVTLPWKKEVTVSKLELKAVGSGELECRIETKDGVSGHTNVGSCFAESSPK